MSSLEKFLDYFPSVKELDLTVTINDFSPLFYYGDQLKSLQLAEKPNNL